MFTTVHKQLALTLLEMGTECNVYQYQYVGKNIFELIKSMQITELNSLQQFNWVKLIILLASTPDIPILYKQ